MHAGAISIHHYWEILKWLQQRPSIRSPTGITVSKQNRFGWPINKTKRQGPRKNGGSLWRYKGRVPLQSFLSRNRKKINTRHDDDDHHHHSHRSPKPVSLAGWLAGKIYIEERKSAITVSVPTHNNALSISLRLRFLHRYVCFCSRCSRRFSFSSFFVHAHTHTHVFYSTFATLNRSIQKFSTRCSRRTSIKSYK